MGIAFGLRFLFGAEVTRFHGHFRIDACNHRADFGGGLFRGLAQLVAETLEICRAHGQGAGAAQTTAYTYDAADRPLTITNPSSATTTFTYDAMGRRSTVTYSNGTVSTLTYDNVGRLATLAHQAASAPSAFTSLAYTYDAAGNRTALSQTRTALAVTANLTYTYDALHRFTGRRTFKGLLGDKFVDAVALVRSTELEAYQEVISSWEREHLLLNV